MIVIVTKAFTVILSEANNPALVHKKSWILQYAQNDEVKKMDLK